MTNFCSSSELRNYESDEKDNSVLIRKFKLKISVKKTNKFSEDIIISDDYNFDFINLNHVDSLIKIAIVHGDIDEWINFGKLNDYDFIFTNNEKYRSLLKKNHKNVFILEGETAYLEFKNILNLLYMRRKEKFNHFINNKFRFVFPKVKNYFKIYHSEFFDEEWYKEVYKIPDNTDPVFHYLVLGFLKGYNPGPDFDMVEYYELNNDVALNQLNPLLHYELFGRKENRAYCYSKEEKELIYSYISNSPYFDENWYVENYDIPEVFSPVEHYLKIGYKEGFNPGPDFDNNEYYDCNKDVRQAGMNPLLHYEQYGKDEGRVIKISDTPQRDYSFILNSPLFDEEWYRHTYGISDDIDAVSHYLNTGHDKGYNPGPNFSTNEYWQCNSDVKDWNMNALVHYEFHGRNEKRKTHFPDK